MEELGRWYVAIKCVLGGEPVPVVDGVGGRRSVVVDGDSADLVLVGGPGRVEDVANPVGLDRLDADGSSVVRIDVQHVPAMVAVHEL